VRRSLEILSVMKEANLSGKDMYEEEVGNGDVDLRWSSLLPVCQYSFISSAYITHTR